MVKLTLDKLLDDRGITRYELEKVTGIKYQTIDKPLIIIIKIKLHAMINLYLQKYVVHLNVK